MMRQKIAQTMDRRIMNATIQTNMFPKLLAPIEGGLAKTGMKFMPNPMA